MVSGPFTWDCVFLAVERFFLLRFQHWQSKHNVVLEHRGTPQVTAEANGEEHERREGRGKT